MMEPPKAAASAALLLLSALLGAGGHGCRAGHPGKRWWEGQR